MKQRYNNKKKTCQECGKVYIYSRYSTGGTKYCSEECANEATKRRRRLYHAEHYGSGLTGSVLLACMYCGRLYDERAQSASRSMYCSKKCQNAAYWLNSPKRQRSMYTIHKEKLKRLKNKKTEGQLYFINNWIQERRCKECGEAFSSIYENAVYCSDECRRRAQNRKHRGADDRLNEVNTVDENITISRLYKRDAGRCYICGRECSFGDYDRVKMAPFGSYPTIEHVVPLSKGGMHAWENVRLACWECNIAKGDRVMDNTPTAERENMIVRSTPHGRKTVICRNKDGSLKAVFRSTADAARLTGYRDKAIQNACRGEMKSYKGYLWSYKEPTAAA